MNAKDVIGLINRVEKRKKVHEELSDIDLAKELADSLGNKELEEEIKDSLTWESGSYKGWGEAGSFKADGEEYNIIISEDEAEKIAKKIVEQDLENEPELFSPEFLSDYIYITDTDKRIIAGEEASVRAEDFYYDLEKGNYKEVFDNIDLTDEWDEWEEKLRNAEEKDAENAEKDIDTNEYKEVEEELEKYLNNSIEEWESNYSDNLEEELKDPIQYFVKDTGIYTLEDLMKQSFIVIDTDSAIDAAISMDGWAHFISLYDGGYETTKSGYVYFRE